MLKRPYRLGPYSFGGWMGKLGVVPRFSLRALRSFPAFFRRFLRRLRVTFVFDAIGFLPAVSRHLITLSVLLTLAPPVNASALPKGPLVLTAGTHREIEGPAIERFMVSNKETLAVSLGQDFRPDQPSGDQKAHTLYLKGKKAGRSELTIWPVNGPKKQYQVHIVAASSNRQQAAIVPGLRRLGLSASFIGPALQVEGRVTSLPDYLLFSSLISSLSDPQEANIFSQVALKRDVRDQVIADIYQSLLSRGVSRVSCRSQGAKFYCQVADLEQIPELEKKRLRQRYLLSFGENKAQSAKNFLIKLKIIQVEHTQGVEFSLGANPFAGLVKQFFNGGLASVLDENPWFFSEKNLHASTIAEPETLTSIGTPSELELGAEIPYQSPIAGGQGLTTQSWKFAGLRIQVSLNEVKGRLKLTYQTQFTRPQNQSVVGSKEKGEIFIESHLPLQLFHLGFKVSKKEQTRVPMISRLPLLGKIFTTRSQNESFKKLYGFVLVTQAQQ